MLPLRVHPHLADLCALDGNAVRVLDSAGHGEAGLHSDDRVICFRCVRPDGRAGLCMVRMGHKQRNLFEVPRDEVAGPAATGIRNRRRVGAELDVFRQRHVVSGTIELNLCAGDGLPGFVNDDSADGDAAFQSHRVFGRHGAPEAPACDLRDVAVGGDEQIKSAEGRLRHVHSQLAIRVRNCLHDLSPPVLQ